MLGVANIATGLCQGFPLSTSSSRTAVAEDVGARSQIAGLSGGAVLGLLLIVGMGLVHDMPLSSLAATVNDPLPTGSAPTSPSSTTAAGTMPYAGSDRSAGSSEYGWLVVIVTVWSSVATTPENSSDSPEATAA